MGLHWRHLVVLGNSDLGQLQPCKGRGLQCSKPHTQHVVVVVDGLMCCDSLPWAVCMGWLGCKHAVWWVLIEGLGARHLSEGMQGNLLLNMEWVWDKCNFIQKRMFLVQSRDCCQQQHYWRWKVIRLSFDVHMHLRLYTAACTMHWAE